MKVRTELGRCTRNAEYTKVYVKYTKVCNNFFKRFQISRRFSRGCTRFQRGCIDSMILRTRTDNIDNKH